MKTCLVVDDSQPLRSIAVKVVETLGLGVREAGNGVEALALCRDRMPDAILLDWNMPVMNGIEFLKALVEEAAGRLPLVIFCSGESSVRHIQEALAAGADDYVIKPFDRDVLALKFRDRGLIG
ncbi:MAG: response regulator [Alphaproteobacteria bacterium]|nr:response regulator [Alphaproteobacteria bacterium]